MYVVCSKCFCQLPYIMKIYLLCISAHECEEVGKKAQKIKVLFSVFFMPLTSLLFLHGSYTRLPVTTFNTYTTLHL